MHNNDEFIIFVVEGPRQEPKIIERIEKIITNKTNKKKIITLPFSTSIYGFWKEFKKDEDQDALEVLINSSRADTSSLTTIDPDQVSAIYLLFDYDGHCANADDDKIIEMLDFFDEETDKGKLFISYPMIEAFRDLKKNNNLCFDRCKLKIETFNDYKGLSSRRSDFTCTEEIESEEMMHIIIENIKKANCIMTSSYTIPSYKEMREITQKCLFNQQKKCFIANHGSVGILSTIPMFIIDYFNENYFSSLSKTRYTLEATPDCTHKFE